MESKTKKELTRVPKQTEFTEISERFGQLDSTISLSEKQKNTALTRQMERIKNTLLKLRECYRQDAIQAIILTK